MMRRLFEGGTCSSAALFITLSKVCFVISLERLVYSSFIKQWSASLYHLNIFMKYVCLFRRPAVLQVSQVFLEIPEEMACLDHVVLLAREGSLGRGEFVVLQVSLVFQEIPEEMACLRHLVLLERKGSLGREEMMT
jgi:hypothetical protein